MQRRTLAEDGRGPSRRPACGRGARAGFSLIEMIVVMAMLAVVAAATAPALRLGPSDEAAIDAAARHVSSLFRMARDSAVRSAEPVTVVVDPVSAVFWLDAEPPSALMSVDAVARRPRDIGAARRVLGAPPASTGPTGPTPLELPAGVRIEGEQRLRFTFRENGSVFGDSVVVRNALDVRIVHLNPWTGDVVVQ